MLACNSAHEGVEGSGIARAAAWQVLSPMRNAEREDSRALARGNFPDRALMAAKHFAADCSPQPSRARDGLWPLGVALLEQKDVGRLLEQASWKNSRRFSRARLDIEGGSEAKMIEPLHGLRRTGERG